MAVVNFLLLISFGAAFTHPVDELMHLQRDDTAVVESVVREARAVGPEHIGDLLGPGVKNAFLHEYGDKRSDGGDQQGYLKKMDDKGNDGYKHFDSYHKKDSDKYGFEVHSEFGKSDKANVDTGVKNAKLQEEEKEGAEEEGDGEETQKSYQVAEDLDDNKKYKKALEGFNFQYYADSGDSEKLVDAEDDGEESEAEEGSETSSSYQEGDAESESLTADDGDGGSETAAEDDYGESAGYAVAEEEEE